MCHCNPKSLQGKTGQAKSFVSEILVRLLPKPMGLRKRQPLKSFCCSISRFVWWSIFAKLFNMTIALSHSNSDMMTSYADNVCVCGNLILYAHVSASNLLHGCGFILHFRNEIAVLSNCRTCFQTQLKTLIVQGRFHCSRRSVLLWLTWEQKIRIDNIQSTMIWKSGALWCVLCMNGSQKQISPPLHRPPSGQSTFDLHLGRC